ncbi:TPA: YadA-like family protein, partial [Serratia fonticola]
SNATDTERQAAQQTAEKIAAYRHNNPEGIPTHQIGAATHLDGEHQAPVTPHLDAPVIDRSSHLDSNVTDAERQAAQQAAENMLAYRHNNPEGIPTHQIGAATHLDGEHQAPVTPHLDAPVIDRSSHLDSNATDAERQAAQQAAEKIAAYRHNNPEGNPTHQTGPATHLDGTHQTPVTPHLDGQHNVAQTLSLAKAHQNDRHKLANAAAPQDGINGKDGTDGKDADMTQVNANTAGLRSMRTEQTAQSHDIKQNGANIAGNQAHIASNTAAINQNSQDIANNRKDIDENSKNIKRVGAMAQAVSSLHYNRNESGYAVAAGEYDGETSIAGGMQFSTSDNSAVTVQMSWDGNAAGAGVGFHSNF